MICVIFAECFQFFSKFFASTFECCKVTVNYEPYKKLPPFYEIIPSEEKCSNIGRVGEQSVPNRYTGNKTVFTGKRL